MAGGKGKPGQRPSGANRKTPQSITNGSDQGGTTRSKTTKSGKTVVSRTIKMGGGGMGSFGSVTRLGGRSSGQTRKQK